MGSNSRDRQAHDTNIEMQRRHVAISAVTSALRPVMSWFITPTDNDTTINCNTSARDSLAVTCHSKTKSSDHPARHQQDRDDVTSHSTHEDNAANLRDRTHKGDRPITKRWSKDKRDTASDSDWTTIKYTELPHWLQDNHFLLTGHRPQLSFQETLNSLFRLHTETVNIWTHFAGFFVYLFVVVQFVIDDELGIKWSDKQWILFSMSGYLVTLLFSSTFHLLHCYSPATYKWCIRIDYIGIHLASIHLCMSWMHYTFHCQPYVQLFYVAAVWLMAPFATAVGLFERFAHPELRAVRALALGALGAVGHVGAMHYTSIYVGYEQMVTEGVHYVFLSAITMYIGGALFAIQFPECCKPGLFDIWGHSHQLLHICVLFAGYFHFTGLKHIALYRISQGCSFFGEPLESS